MTSLKILIVNGQSSPHIKQQSPKIHKISLKPTSINLSNHNPIPKHPPLTKILKHLSIPSILINNLTPKIPNILILNPKVNLTISHLTHPLNTNSHFSIKISLLSQVNNFLTKTRLIRSNFQSLSITLTMPLITTTSLITPTNTFKLTQPSSRKISLNFCK